MYRIFKAQVSMEFMFLVITSLFILSIFSVYFISNVASYSNYKEEKDVEVLLEKIKWNLNYVYMAGDGFHHFLILPENLNNKPYSINFTTYGFFIIVDRKAYYKDLMFNTINGKLEPGKNNEIINKGGVIYVKRTSA